MVNFLDSYAIIANTSKHLKISRTNAQVRHVDQVRESIAIIQHEDSEGEYYNTVSTVVVDHVDGSRIPVEIYLYLCFLAFTSLLIELKVIPGEPKIYRVKRSFYKSREEATLEASFNFTRFESVNVAMSSYIYDGNPLCPIRATDQNDKFECEIPINYEIKKGVF